MRIWLDPHKLPSFELMPGDVITAIQNQNTEVAAGEIGGLPQPQGQMLNATVTAQSRLQTPEQFRNIVVKSDPTGARVLLGDVARVELGADNYSAIDPRQRPSRRRHRHFARARRQRAATPPTLVKAEGRARSRRECPPGYSYAFANDTHRLHQAVDQEVVKTLIEAILLVVLVMFVFLQSWRATLIPVIAVPVVLLGTFGDALRRSASRSTR